MSELSVGFIDKVQQKVNPENCKDVILNITKLKIVKINEV